MFEVPLECMRFALFLVDAAMADWSSLLNSLAFQSSLSLFHDDDECQCSECSSFQFSVSPPSLTSPDYSAPCEINMYETFDESGFYASEQALLSLYAVGRISGCTLHIGHGRIGDSNWERDISVGEALFQPRLLGFESRGIVEQLVGTNSNVSSDNHRKLLENTVILQVLKRDNSIRNLA